MQPLQPSNQCWQTIAKKLLIEASFSTLARGLKLNTQEQSEKFLDLGTVTRPLSSIYARVNCSVIRDWCTRVQGHPRNLFRRPWNFGFWFFKFFIEKITFRHTASSDHDLTKPYGETLSSQWNFGLSSLKHHTWPYHASVLWYTEANLSFQMQQRNFPRPYLRNDTMDFLF